MGILGSHAMFDGIDEDDLAGAIKIRLLEVFGHYPILDISERWEIWDEEEAEYHVLRDYQVVLDTEKLNLIGGFQLNYVDGLLERVIKERLRDPEARLARTGASKKYCFSDTEDWWDAARVEGSTEGRETFELLVTIG